MKLQTSISGSTSWNHRAPAWLLFWALAGCSSGTETLGDAGPIACANNDQCPADAYCAAGFCAPGDGNQCDDDEPCPTDFICQVVTGCGAARCSGNVCVQKPCTVHAECDGVCIDGVCGPAPACTEGGAPCPAELLCVGGVCTPYEELLCTEDGDCPNDGDVCIGGHCAPGVSCTDSSECPADRRCIQGVCNDPCTEDGDCGSPAAFFSCDVPSGECQQRCLTSGQCPDQQICEMGLCVPAECQTDPDCTGTNERCEGGDAGHGVCAPFTPCDNGMCPVGSICNPATDRCDPLPGCRTDRDCEATEYCDSGFCKPSTSCAVTPCPTDFTCIADVCVPFTCRGNDDCTLPELCIGGACEAPMTADFITEVRIITPAGTVRPGTTYRFVALALDQAGRVVPGIEFLWTSTSTGVATIDGAGLATGRQAPGVTQIRAGVDTAAGRVVSAPVSLTNLGPIDADQVRITVVRLVSGAPLSGVSVELVHGSGTVLDGTTDNAGQVVFDAVPVGAYSVTAAHGGYDYVSVLGQTGRDLLLPLPPLSRPDRVAGARGTVDLSQAQSQGAISFSLSGSSLPSPLFAFDAGRLFGGELFTVEVPMIGGVPVPAANTLAFELMGFPVTLKDTFYARGEAGNRALFTFGGRIELGANGLGPQDLGNFLTAVLPFYQRCDHAVRPVVPLVALPTITDAIDIDGDGDTAETVPDWASFGAFAMTPATPQSLRYQISVDNLPFVAGGNANTLIVLAGTLLPGLGFVPLGLDGQSDPQGTGIVESFVSKMAPPHDGLEAGDYAVMVTASRTMQGGLPGPGSTRLFVGGALPTDVDFSDGWLDGPVDASFGAVSRDLGLPTEQGIDLYHAVFRGPTGAWHVYADAPPDESVAIPSAPAGLDDRTIDAALSVDGIDLVTGQSARTVFDAAAGGALALDRATRGFARVDLP